MECLWIREEESIASHVFRFIPVVPLLGREVARAFLFSCVLSSNPNIFLSQIPFAPLSLGSMPDADLGVAHLPGGGGRGGRENSSMFQWSLGFSEAGHCPVV